jgi:hypothetical protein
VCAAAAKAAVESAARAERERRLQAQTAAEEKERAVGTLCCGCDAEEKEGGLGVVYSGWVLTYLLFIVDGY